MRELSTEHMVQVTGGYDPYNPHVNEMSYNQWLQVGHNNYTHDGGGGYNGGLGGLGGGGGSGVGAGDGDGEGEEEPIRAVIVEIDDVAVILNRDTNGEWSGTGVYGPASATVHENGTTTITYTTQNGSSVSVQTGPDANGGHGGTGVTFGTAF